MSPGFEHTNPPAALSAPTIVIAEDERITAEHLRRKLESWGYRVQAIVASGEEAIRAAEVARPDLLVMDIRLKGTMDGVEAARRIKAHMNIPVIYAASFNDPATLRRAQLTEPSGLISKPYDDHEMRFTIATALARRAMERQIAEVEERHRRVLAMSTDIVLLLQNGRIVNANTAGLVALGYTLTDLQGIDPLRLTAPESTMSMKLVLQEIESGIPHSGIETTILTRTGSSLNVVLSGEPCTAGGVSASLIVMTDRTRLAAAEAEATRFAEELFDVKAEADERVMEVAQARQELARLGEAIAEERHALQKATETWKEEIAACATTIQQCLSGCDDHVSSPEQQHLFDQIRKAVHTLQRVIAADFPAAASDSSAALTVVPHHQHAPDPPTVRLPI